MLFCGYDLILVVCAKNVPSFSVCFFFCSHLVLCCLSIQVAGEEVRAHSSCTEMTGFLEDQNADKHQWENKGVL